MRFPFARGAVSVTLSLLTGIAMPSLVSAEGSAVDCDVVYDRITASHPLDLSRCEVEVAPYKLNTCRQPAESNLVRPSSHMILAIDASGSMAGRVGRQTKMAVAKREALAFLQEIPREIKVGLVVYGHRGNNNIDGKAESCGASEMVHSFDTSRQTLKNTIATLKPTGWTPLGGVLQYVATVVKRLPAPRQGDLAPVVYLISDGKESCDGDPVAAAGALYVAGVQTVVNTVGFDVDAETGVQLKAIADAAGGTYYPAKSAQALRKQLDAIRQAEAEMARYQYCVRLNVGAIAAVHHNARIKLAGCYQRNNPQNRRMAVIRAMRKAEQSNQPEATCANKLNKRARQEVGQFSGWLSERMDDVGKKSRQLVDAYYESARLR